MLLIAHAFTYYANDTSAAIITEEDDLIAAEDDTVMSASEEAEAAETEENFIMSVEEVYENDTMLAAEAAVELIKSSRNVP